MADLLAEGLTLSPNLGRCRIRRLGNRVEFDLKVDVNVSGLTRIFASAIPGFSALGSYPMSAAIFHANAKNVGASAFAQGGYAGVFYPTGSPLQTGSTTAWPNPGCIAWTDSYPTADPWPAALPGAPA